MISSNEAAPLTSLRALNQRVLWNELGILTLLMMEIAWFTPWYKAHVPGAASNPGIILFLGLLLYSSIVMVISRIMDAGERRKWLKQLILLGTLALGLYIFLQRTVYAGSGMGVAEVVSSSLRSIGEDFGEVPAPAIVTLAVLFLWWRGIACAGLGKLDSIATRRRFQTGVTALGIYAVFHREPENIFLIEMTPIFFIIGLQAVTLGRVHRMAHRRAHFSLPFSGRWFLGILIISLITVGVGIVGSLMLRTELVRQLAAGVAEIWVGILRVFVVLIGPLLNWLFPLFERIASVLEQPAEQPPIDPDTGGAGGGEGSDSVIEPVSFQFQVPEELIIALVLLILFIFVFFIVRWARRRRRSYTLRLQDDEVKIGSDGLQGGFESVLRGLKEGLQTIRKFGIGRRLLVANTIRRTYAQMLTLAEKRGQARQPWQTPFEFQGPLEGVFPDSTDQVALITRAYTQIRYGELPEEEEIIAKVKGAWDQIRLRALAREQTN